MNPISWFPAMTILCLCGKEPSHSLKSLTVWGMRFFFQSSALNKHESYFQDLQSSQIEKLRESKTYTFVSKVTTRDENIAIRNDRNQLMKIVSVRNNNDPNFSSGFWTFVQKFDLYFKRLQQQQQCELFCRKYQDEMEF